MDSDIKRWRKTVSRLSANLLNVFLPEGDSFTPNAIILCCRMTPVASTSFPIWASDFLHSGVVSPDFLPLILIKTLQGLLGDTMRLQEPRSWMIAAHFCTELYVSAVRIKWELAATDRPMWTGSFHWLCYTKQLCAKFIVLIISGSRVMLDVLGFFLESNQNVSWKFWCKNEELHLQIWK